MKVNLIILSFLSVLLHSCFLNEPKRHDNFESISDCFVYEKEVESDWNLFGTVEYIDTTKASGCVKSQLTNTFLLHIEDTVIVVYGEHPKNHIDLIKKLYSKYYSDSTQLTDFIHYDSGYTITIGRLCKDTSNFYHNRIIDWKDLTFKKESSNYILTKEQTWTFWYDWNKELPPTLH